MANNQGLFTRLALKLARDGGDVVVWTNESRKSLLRAIKTAGRQGKSKAIPGENGTVFGYRVEIVD